MYSARRIMYLMRRAYNIKVFICYFFALYYALGTMN